jgi:hypothetical protein
MKRSLALFAALIAVAALPVPALAGWQVGGTGKAYSKATSIVAGNAPTASVSGRNVTVNWSASSVSGGPTAASYAIKRYNGSGQQQTIGSGCSGTITGTSCTENAVQPGNWRYTVTPRYESWTGAESAQGAEVTVGSPSLSLAPSTVTSLPQDLTGQIQDFTTGQAVTFRLDDPTNGQVLTGNISPTPVPNDGTANVSVTIPNGTANGAHDVYAIGNQGDTASAAINVNVSTPTTASTSAWDISDASSGTASNQSSTSAFLNDGRSAASGAFATSFNASRYLEVKYNSPLRSGVGISGANFNFNYAATQAGDQVCFYFEVRRVSTGTVIGTHGSAASPVDCQTGTAFKLSTTALPEVTSTAIANDLAVRVFARSSGARPLNVDLATVSGTVAPSQAFTLFDATDIDASSGTPTSLPWSLYAAGDGAMYTSAAGWATAFSGSRFLKLAFPSYVPTGATGVSATLKHAFRSEKSGATTCYYVEAYNGNTLIGTHFSAASPSCNATTSFVTDTIALPEVDTVAEANNLSIRIYARNSAAAAGQRRSQHDLAELQVTYTAP